MELTSRVQFLLMRQTLLVLGSLLVGLAASPSAQQAGALGGVTDNRPARGPARPAPRATNGKILFGGATPAEKGVWLSVGLIRDVPRAPMRGRRITGTP